MNTNMPNSSIFLLLVVFFNATEVVAQKVVSFDEYGQIGTISASENFVGVIAKNEHGSPYKALLYNKAGDKLFEKEVSTSWVMLATPVEPLNYFIVAVAGGAEGPPPDVVKAYDIKTGQEVWSTTTNALEFAISRNGLHMVPIEGAHDRSSPLEIIDLRNGTQNTPLPAFRLFYGNRANWLDDERVIFAERMWGDNPEYTAEAKMRAEKDQILDKRRRKIYEQLRELRTQLEMGRISDEDFEKQRLETVAAREKIQEEAVSLMRRIGEIPKKLPQGTQLFIYNIQSQTVESVREVRTPVGEPILIEGPLHVNRDGGILFRCALLISDPWPKRKSSHLIRFNDSLEPEWVTHLSGSHSMIKVNDTFYLRIVRGKTVSIIENETGEIMPLDKVLQENVDFQDLDESLLRRKTLRVFHKHVGVDEEAITVIFKKQGDFE